MSMNEWPLISSALETQDALSAALREIHGPESRLECWASHPVSKRGKHRAVRFNLNARLNGESRARQFQWVGKSYERDEKATKVTAVLRELAAAGCASGNGLVLPAVVSYNSRCRLLLLKYETGGSVVRAITQHGESVLHAIGTALSALHTAPVTPETVISPASLLSVLRERIAALRVTFPDEAKRLSHALGELGQHAPHVPATPSFLHGDLGPAQLLWKDGRVVVLDFDDCACGDPAFDLGNLFTQLRRLTLRKPDKLPDFASLRRSILEAYQRASGADPDLAGRVTWYEQLTLMRKIRFLLSDTSRQQNCEVPREREAIALLEELPALAVEDVSRRDCPCEIGADDEYQTRGT